MKATATDRTPGAIPYLVMSAQVPIQMNVAIATTN